MTEKHTPTLEDQFNEQFGEGRLATRPLWEYWVAVDGKTGELGFEWADKPHRLVFDLLHHAVALRNSHTALVAALKPFSDIAGEYFARDLSRHETIVAVMRPDGEWLKITAGNLFDARAAYAALSAEGEKDAPKDDGWIEWKGGECPVAGDTLVEVLLREETATTGEAMEAGKYSWGHFGEGSRYADHDIVSYRVVKP